MDEPSVPEKAITVRIAAGNERVDIVAEDRRDVRVDGRARVARDGNLYTVDEAKSRLTVSVPMGADLLIGTQSGRVGVSGAAGATSINTESGRVQVDEAASVDIRTSSGKVSVGEVQGESRVRTDSARVEIGASGDADVATDSGRISVGRCTGNVRAHCVSGRVNVDMIAVGDVDVETVSGRIEVMLAPGAVPYTVQGASPAAERPDGTNCTVAIRTVSGRVKVTPS